MTPREIVAVVYESRTDCPSLGSRVRLLLSCGHVKRLKASQASRAKTHCPQCEAQRQAKGMARG